MGRMGDDSVGDAIGSTAALSDALKRGQTVRFFVGRVPWALR